MAKSIRCVCGHRVRPRDVIEGGVSADACGGGFVYLKYVCGQCERLVQAWLTEEEWADGRVLEARVERAPSERSSRASRELGLITCAELRRFEADLAQSDASLRALRVSVDPHQRRARRTDRRDDRPIRT